MNKEINQTEIEEKKRKSGDLLLKILSVVFAVFIWFFIIGVESPITEKKFTGVVVETHNMQNLTDMGLSIISDSSFVCEVTVSGKKSDINKMKSSDIKASVDLNEVTAAGTNVLPIYIEETGSIKTVSLEPGNLLVYIDKKISTPIPVVAEIKQSRADAGVKIGTPIPTKEFVTVSGPEADLKRIVCAKVDLELGTNKIERPFYMKEKIVLQDENGEEVKSAYIKVDTKEIECYISVTMEKTIPLTINYKYGYYTSKNTDVTINPQSIVIEGTPDFLNSINEISLGTIDEKTIENDMSLKYNIVLPEGAKNKSGIGSADVDIKFIDTDTRIMVLSKDDIKVIAPSSFQYVILNEEMQIKLRGTAVNLSYMTKSKISANIDLSKITEKGVHSIPVTVTVVNETSVFSYGEYTVNVEIY